MGLTDAHYYISSRSTTGFTCYISEALVLASEHCICISVFILTLSRSKDSISISLENDSTYNILAIIISLYKKKQIQRSYRTPRVSHHSCGQVQWRAVWCLKGGSFCYVCNPYIFDPCSQVPGMQMFAFILYSFPRLPFNWFISKSGTTMLRAWKSWILDPLFMSPMILSKFI